MTLKEWLRTSGRSSDSLAKELEIAPETLSRITHGKQRPSLGLAVRLEEVTGIPARSFAL